jgi:hypothetical protein
MCKVNSPYNVPRSDREGIQTSVYAFHDLCAGWGWIVNAPFGRFTPEKKYGTYCTDGRVGHVFHLDGCGGTSHAPGFEPRTSQRVATLSAGYAIPASIY